MTDKVRGSTSPVMLVPRSKRVRIENETPEDELRRIGRHVKGIEFAFAAPEPDSDDESTRADTDPSGELVKGALWLASITLVDKVFEDIQELSGDRDAETWISLSLPPKYVRQYDAGFARQFLVALVDVTVRVTSSWEPLPTVAHELALRLLLDEAEFHLHEAKVKVAESWRLDLEEALFEDLDHEFLYAPEEPSLQVQSHVAMAPMDFNSWFEPFNDEYTQSPFTYPDGDYVS